jgi:hypothetical protein
MQRTRTVRATQCRRRRARLREGFAGGLPGESSVHGRTRLPGAGYSLISSTLGPGNSASGAGSGTVCSRPDHYAELALRREHQ